MEYAIGDIVRMPDGRRAKVVESPGRMMCTKCSQWWVNGCERTCKCLGSDRSDGKDIIYVALDRVC